MEQVRNLEQTFPTIRQTEISWAGLYMGDLDRRLAGTSILELGAGSGLNTLIMATLGAARVVAIDITEHTRRLISQAAKNLGLGPKVDVRIGDFVEMDFEPESFDFVIGKAFLHHLTHDLEDRYLKRAARLLRRGGEGRFFEPAINSALLDKLRWIVPVRGRPSCLNRRAFSEWKEKDHHPDRDNSSAHYRRACSKYFENVEITPYGGFERLHRLLPPGSFQLKFRRWALKGEKRWLPSGAHLKIARSQTIIVHKPRHAD